MPATETGEPIPRRRERIALLPAKPTQADPEAMHRHLNELGLTCPATATENLRTTIAQIRAALPAGKTESFLIARSADTAALLSPASAAFLDSAARAPEGTKDFLSANVDSVEADGFFAELVAGSRGGTQVVTQLAGADVGTAGFAATFARENPAGLMLVVNLARLGLVPLASGTWRPGSDVMLNEYAGTFAEMLDPTRFARLSALPEKEGKNNARPGDQPGRKWGVTAERSQTFHDKLTTVDAVKQKYCDIAYVASSAVVDGIERRNLEAMLANEVLPLQDSSAANYDSRDKSGKDQQLLVMLAMNPTMDGSAVTSADGVGALAITWRLRVKDFRDSSTDPVSHDTIIDVDVRGVHYLSVYREGVNPTTFQDQLDEDRRLCG